MDEKLQGMERDLFVERLYSLGDFKNIKFSNSLKGIPAEYAMNDKITTILFYQQTLACEIAYRKYYELIQKLVKDKVEDVITELEKEREQTFLELAQELDKVNEQRVLNNYGKKETKA